MGLRGWGCGRGGEGRDRAGRRTKNAQKWKGKGMRGTRLTLLPGAGPWAFKHRTCQRVLSWAETLAGGSATGVTGYAVPARPQLHPQRPRASAFPCSYQQDSSGLRSYCFSLPLTHLLYQRQAPRACARQACATART